MSRYADAHRAPHGEGDARPTALQVLEDEGLVGKLAGKVFLVTGVSRGIGFETMRALYASGGHVFVTARDQQRGRQAIEDVKARTSGGEITLLEMDNENLASVKRAAELFLAQSKALNVLILNAGVVGIAKGKTKDGFERHLGVNFIAHFYLFQLLENALLTSSTPESPSRVVSVASIGHRCGRIRFNDLNFQQEAYNPWQAYGQSKTATIYLANEIERRYASHGLHATSVHPGLVMTFKQEQKGWEDEHMLKQLKNAEQGASTTIYAALSEEWKSKGGKYLADCVEQGPTQHPEDPFFIGDDGYAAWAYDAVAAERLWGMACSLVDAQDDS